MRSLQLGDEHLEELRWLMALVLPVPHVALVRLVPELEAFRVDVQAWETACYGGTMDTNVARSRV